MGSYQDDAGKNCINRCPAGEEAVTEGMPPNEKRCVSTCPGGEYPDETGKCIDLAVALKSGLLLRYGVSAGVAAAVNVPIQPHPHPGASDTYVASVGVTPMGYVAGFPAYWGWRGDRARYCARGIPNDANREAKGVTHKYKLRQKAEGNHPNVGHCWPGVIGAFLGISGSFQANTVVNAAYAISNPASRSVRPLISFGGIYAPVPQINLLTGVTFSNLQADTAPTMPGTTAKVTPQDLQVWTWVAGVGGPFDLASIFFGVK